MNILALDIATKTGWAANYPILASGVDNFVVRRGSSPGTRYLRFAYWLGEKIMIVQPVVIFYEQAHHRGGAATEIAYKLQGVMEVICAEEKVDYMSVHSATLKKHATGKGNANKRDVIDACVNQLKIVPQDDNEADALWLLDYGMRELTGRGIR